MSGCFDVQSGDKLSLDLAPTSAAATTASVCIAIMTDNPQAQHYPAISGGPPREAGLGRSRRRTR